MMENSLWHSSNASTENHTNISSLKEELLASDAKTPQTLWESSDGINVAEPVVEIKMTGDYLEGVESISSEPHGQGGRAEYPYHSVGVVNDYNKDELDLMLMYNEGNQVKVAEHYQDKNYSAMEQTGNITKFEQNEDGSVGKSGAILFSHSILEPETSDPRQNLLSISDMSPSCILKSFSSPAEMVTTNLAEAEDQMSDGFNDRYRSACPFCRELFTHVIAHMMTTHSDMPLVTEAMSYAKGSPQRRALFMALKNKGHFFHSQSGQGHEIPTSSAEMKNNSQTSNQKITCKYCSRHYKAHKIRYHYMKCSAYKESTNHNTFTFRREMRKQDHYKKCMDILQAFPFVHEKVASEILARMRRDKITTHILNDPLLLRYAEVHSQGDVNSSFLHKVKQDLRNLGKLILSLREKDDNIQYMADVLKPSSFGLVVRCVQEHSGFNSDTCSYQRVSTPMNTGYILRKCTELLKEEALKTMDEGLVQQCNEFTDLMINDWKDCMSLAVARNRKREKLPLLKDIQVLQQYFDREINLILKKLAETQAASHWRRLSRLALGSVVLFNRGSSRKIDRMTMTDFESRCSSETILSELEDKLSNVERESVGDLTKINIQENPGKKVPILLKPLHMQAIKLMNEMRSLVGVVDNPFVFARPGGETPLRGDVIREFAHRAGLEQPNNITPSNLRKHVIITNHLSTFPQAHKKEQTMSQTPGNSGDNVFQAQDYSQCGVQHNTNDLQKMGEDNIMEANGIPVMEPKLEDIQCNVEEMEKKEFNFRDCGNRYWFLGYNSSDFDIESGDDSDYEPNRRKEKMKGSKTKKYSKKEPVTENIDSLSGGQTPSNGATPNKVRHYIRGKTRYTYCKWTEVEETIVLNAMEHHFKSGTLPGKLECLKVMGENIIFQKRKWEDVKNYVRNKMVRLARTNSALQNSVREFCSTASEREFCSTASELHSSS